MAGNLVGGEEDIPYGKGLVNEMTPFLEDLIQQGLTKKTIRKHVENLWLLGGEIIRSVG